MKTVIVDFGTWCKTFKNCSFGYDGDFNIFNVFKPDTSEVVAMFPYSSIIGIYYIQENEE